MSDFNFAPFASRSVVPYTFGDRVIKYRIPYEFSAEHIIGPSLSEEFREDVFKNAIKMPFEIWRMRCLLTAMDSAVPPVIFEPQPTTLEKRIRLGIQAVTLNQAITKAPVLVEHLMADDSRWWEWDIPFTIDNQTSIGVAIASDVFPAYCIPDVTAQACALAAVQVSQVRVEVTFQGYLLVLAPADER